MSLTAEFNGYYVPPNATSGQSAQLQDYAIYNPGGMACQLQDFAIYNPAGMSAQLQETGGSPVIIQGVNLATGQFQLVNPGDVVTRSDDSVYNSTGINGITGLLGVTGVAPLGATGLTGATGLNITGLDGNTGIVGIQGSYGATGVQGVTGLLGVTGLVGITGMNGEEGFRFLGATGIHGVTGLVGVTGLTVTGFTGLQGETGLLGVTGIIGSTGASPSNIGLSGEAGIIGVTGLVGVTGITVVGLPGPFYNLSVQNPVASTATYTVDSSALTINEQYLQIISWGTLPTSTSNSIQLSIGSALLVDTSIFLDPQATGYNTYYMFITMIRTSNTTQEIIAELCGPNDQRYVLRTSGAINLAISNLLTLSLPGGGVIRGLIIRKGLQA